MATAFETIKLSKNAFLMGDFNFDSSWKSEQASIDPEFEDIFLTLNKNVESPTMPPTPDFPAWRPDKILSRRSSQWKPSSIDIIGKFYIPSF
jgi:endonuclease/exonuclease/phosphatase family metal-dependent hydrolase